MANTVVLYHEGCQDGFAAAYAAWRNLGDRAVYLPASYGRPLPTKVGAARTVYMLDFSVPRQETLALRATGKDVAVIDHHRTAKQNLEGLENCVFDDGRSGCVLAWRYFVGGVVPELLLHVEDRDLWRFALPGTREIYMALQVVDRTFGAWDALVRGAEPSIQQLVNEGRIMLRHQDVQVERICKERHWVDLDGIRCLAVNSPLLASEVGERLAEASREAGGAPVGLVYHAGPDGIYASLRSVDAYDVSEIAKRHGGGGHRAAAGCMLEQWPHRL